MKHLFFWSILWLLLGACSPTEVKRSFIKVNDKGQFIRVRGEKRCVSKFGRSENI